MHDHHGHHSHHAPSFSGKINLSFGLAVFANLSFTIVEAALALEADSMGLLADAGHNLSDVLGLVLAWIASYLATKKAGARFSYGYRRTTILAALANAITLLFASIYIAFGALEKLSSTTTVQTEIVIYVAAIGIVINGGAALLFMKQSHHDLNIKGAFLHLAFDALVSAGVVVAGIVMLYTDAYWIDPVVALAIVSVILYLTWRMLGDALSLILDAVPPNIDPEAVAQFLRNISGVTAVHDLHIWAMSTQETCLTAHLVMPEHPLWAQPNGYQTVSRALAQQFSIHHVTLQVEQGDNCQTQDCHFEEANGI
ncbi:MAG TPA: cation transporter [Gammaproteobacteria bacterium]|jgi:cobalt-zinc-cadmium efflux system protein|nr:cation transporter [Gammaproteobacteria bacterium]MDA8626672.1 cation diffusion facilitator family transporter [Pseudomonadales bacterium]MBT5464374.1 cation transporter [Gammaproteobacteria bacterium]MBT6792894.1 cation transporter [Gammaproteobacteria bacterium]MCH9785707.1 cation diffusion facilitator family transporter [Gammaproteobacteria bacterium]